MVHFNTSSSIQEAAISYAEAGLTEKEVCPAIYPDCFKQQALAKTLMQKLGKEVQNSSSASFKQEIKQVEDKLASQPAPSKKPLGVVSSNPKKVFSLETLLLLQKSAKNGNTEAQKTEKLFNDFVLSTKEHGFQATSAHALAGKLIEFVSNKS